jgi:hypothetical protein
MSYERTLCVIFMARVVTLLIIAGLYSCTRTQTADSSVSATKGSPQSVTTSDFYSISKTYGDIESDSLLFPTEVMQKVKYLRVWGIEIKGQPYGGGDCWGKIKRYVLEKDTLTIDKHNCGEHGFGNKVFLKKGDSLTLAVTYEIDQLQNEKGSWFNDLLEIVEFKKNEFMIKTSVETITDWNKIKLDRPPGKSDRLKDQNASGDYLYYLEEYKKIRAYEFVEEE